MLRLVSIWVTQFPHYFVYPQGDLFSALIFVLTTDLLQSIFNEALDNNLIGLPIITKNNRDFLIIQYADDTIIILHACPLQIQQVQNILMHFRVYTGLRVNYNKSMMVPMNVPAHKIKQLSAILGCAHSSFPFTYLGLPLGISKPKVEDFEKDWI